MKGIRFIAAFIVMVLIMSMTACQTKNRPQENKLNTQTLSDTVGIKPGQTVKDYITVRKKALHDYSQAKPQDSLVGMVSFNDWQNLDQVDHMAKKYGVTPVMVDFSFRVNNFSFGEIKLEGRTLRDGFTQAMEQRFSTQEKGSEPGHGMGTPEMQQKIRQQMAEQQAREKEAYQSGQPIIYGLLITGQANQFQKLSNDMAVKLLDALPASDEEVQFVPDNIRSKLQPINVEK